MSPTRTDRKWTIRDQMPDGTWGPERSVTLAEFQTDHKAKTTIALARFNSSRPVARAR